MNPTGATVSALDDAGKTAGSVYRVSVFRVAPGHRNKREKSLAQPGNGTAGNVLLQHLEGGPWHFLTVAHYNSMGDFAKGEKSNVTDTLKPGGGWLGVSRSCKRKLFGDFH
jgi:hypothetical protein